MTHMSKTLPRMASILHRLLADGKLLFCCVDMYGERTLEKWCPYYTGMDKTPGFHIAMSLHLCYRATKMSCRATSV